MEADTLGGVLTVVEGIAVWVTTQATTWTEKEPNRALIMDVHLVTLPVAMVAVLAAAEVAMAVATGNGAATS